ncbi:protein TOPAZ1 isoform X2 [Cygnus olor]|uniref:protein TOPAZ1 isoform X2 n=1 Tax=Cygnus olor TaxID=8869 RepID=UPI001ADE35EE|nr:protein TOPAZ1 isoform X2 [Cygnus olor]
MPQLRSGKVVTGGKVKMAQRVAAGLSSLGAEVGCEPGELAGKKSSRPAPERKAEQSLPSSVHPAALSGVSPEQHALLLPMQKEQVESCQRLPGKKNKGIQCRVASQSKNGVAVQIPDAAVCEDWRAATRVAGTCWEKTGSRRTGQGQQPFFSRITLQKKFSGETGSPEGLNLSGFPESSRSSGKKRKRSYMELKLQIPTSEEELDSTESTIPCLPEAEVLQPRNSTCSTEIKGIGSLMILKLQIPDLKRNLGNEESSLSKPQPWEVVDNPGKMNRCSLKGSEKPKKKEKKCLRKKGRLSLLKSKLQGTRKRGGSALVELHRKCLESKKRAVSLKKKDSLALLHVQGVSGPEQPTARGKLHKRCVIEQQQSSDPQKGTDSLGESAKKKWKKNEQDSGTQAVKNCKANLTKSEDPNEKEPRYSESPTVVALGGTQNKSFLCHPEAKRSVIQLKKRKARIDRIACLQSLSVTTAEKVINKSAKRVADHCRNTLKHCNSLLCVTRKNPVVRLEACSYINTFVKSLLDGTASTFNLSRFFHLAQHKRKSACPDSTVEQSEMNCSTNTMQKESSPIKSSLLFNEVKSQHKKGYFSCHQSQSNKFLSEKKSNIGRKRAKKMKISEMSAGQNVFTNGANECTKCELKTEDATSSSSAVFGLKHKEMTLSDSWDCTDDLHTGNNTCEAQEASAQRKDSTKSLAFEGGFKKTSELSVVAKGEASSCEAPQWHSATSGSLRALTQACGVSNCHKSMTGGKLNKVNKKLCQFTCQRTIPMTGKNVWPCESCARTSEWVPKNHWSISEGKRLLSPVFEESSDKSSVKAVGNNAATENSRQLDLCTSLAKVKERAHNAVDLNAKCLTSVETSESSSMDIDETCGMSNENVESPVKMVTSAVAFNPDDTQEVKATSNFTAKPKNKNKGAVTKRSPSVTVQNNTSTSNKSRINLSCKASVVNQTLSDVKLMKALNTRNLTNFRIPLRRNKPESRKLECISSSERKTCSPLELLDSASVSQRQKRGEETWVNSEKQPLPVVSDATSTASMKKNTGKINSKDLHHDGSETLSNEMPTLPEHASLYPCPAPERQLESSPCGFSAAQCVWKSNFPEHSGNAVDHPVALEIHGGGKSRVNRSQPKSDFFPDILEAYKEDVLVIDVIQDDPDLFGTNDEEELTLTACDNWPTKASCSSIFIKEEKQNLKPEYAVISENRGSVNANFRDITVQDSGMLNHAENSQDLAIKATDIKTHNSSSRNSPLRGVTEDSFEDGQLRKQDGFLKSFEINEKFRFADGVAALEPEEKGEAEKSDCKYTDLMNCELLSRLPLHVPNVKVLSESTVLKARKNDCTFSGKGLSLPLQNHGDSEPWTTDKNAKASHSVQQILGMIDLPRKYCRYYFMTLRGCERAKCWFRHVPEQRHEKICMAILKTYISIKEKGLLKRAVQIFVRYYREVTPGEDFAFQVLNDLLVCLLKNCLLQEVFQILRVAVQVNTLPAVDVLLKVFEHVASLNIRNAVPKLISTFRKLIDAGMFLEFEHFNYITKLLQQLQVSSQEINVVLNIKSRFQERHFKSNWLFDCNLVMVEIQHCKEKNDWSKMGTLYVNARTGCEHFDDLQKLSLCIAEILTRDSEKDRPGVPFCDFADAVITSLTCNEADRIFIGRTGISVMNSYRKVLQWRKGRTVLDKLHELQINFTVLKGLIGAENLASRCQIVNNAAEIFLKTGSLDGATWVLRESEWTTNTPLWPCDEEDILNRHNLLCSLVHKYMRQSLYRQALEVLQNLPGFQNSSDTVDVSQYSCVFNLLIKACFESKNLGVSSSAVDFMLSKNIAVDFFLLRGLITGLGRSCLWSKARTYYKTALSLGCYLPLEGNLHHKILPIPFYVSEVEMLLAIELFLVSNASDIQSPGATTQSLQIILKRCEDQTVQSNSDYQAGMERLSLAAHVSDPKLFLKRMTVNVNMEEVYSLEHTSALKWLQENMKWAGKVWLFQ